MYESDYLMRMIRQFAEMLAALLFGKRSKGQDITFEELNELSLSFTGLSLHLLITLDSTQILNLYSAGGKVDITKAYVSARLFCQLAEQERSGERTLLLKSKALDLLNEVHQQLDGYLNEEHESLTQSLRDVLKQ